jgi:anti-sigma factor RsiW
MDKNISDSELDTLLNVVGQPNLPDGFADRLQARLQTASTNNVVMFPGRKISAPPSRRVWLSAIPLAASLAIGIYIGAIGAVPEGLDGSLVSDAGETVLGTGIEDAEAVLNGDLS